MLVIGGAHSQASLCVGGGDSLQIRIASSVLQGSYRQYNGTLHRMYILYEYRYL